MESAFITLEDYFYMIYQEVLFMLKSSWKFRFILLHFQITDVLLCILTILSKTFGFSITYILHFKMCFCVFYAWENRTVTKQLRWWAVYPWGFPESLTIRPFSTSNSVCCMQCLNDITTCQPVIICGSIFCYLPCRNVLFVCFNGRKY